MKKASQLANALLIIAFSQNPVSAEDPPRYKLEEFGTANTFEFRAINKSGQGAGAIALPGGVVHAVRYSAGITTDMDSLGSTSSYGIGINDSGQVTGNFLKRSGIEASRRAFLYSGGVMRELGTFGGNYSYGEDVNNLGQVTGFAGKQVTVFATDDEEEHEEEEEQRFWDDDIVSILEDEN